MIINIKTIEWKTSEKGSRCAIITCDSKEYLYLLNRVKENDINKLLKVGVDLEVEIEERSGWSTITKIKGEEIFESNIVTDSVPHANNSKDTLNRILYITNDIKSNTNLSEDQLTKYELELSALNIDITIQYAKNYKNFKQRVFDESNKIKNEDSKMSMTAIKNESEKQAWMEKVAYRSNEMMIDSIKGVTYAIKDRLKKIRN